MGPEGNTLNEQNDTSDAQNEAQSEISSPPEGIRAFDQYGREVIVAREEWAANVLPNMIKEAWDEPEQLYVILLNSFNDNFFAEVTQAAEHLYKTDTLPARGVCMWAIVLMQADRLDEAETALTQFLAMHPADGSVLLNLAKVYAGQGHAERANETLWKALETEPNLDNGLAWFATQAQERGGDEAAKAALEQLAALPTSWRAQLWLARAELVSGNLTGARALYTAALERAPRPVPADFLMQMSGDLGGHGHLAELLEFTAPHFAPEWHGLPVGNNLIKASVDTNDLELAEAIKQQLHQLNRPDWKEALGFWDTEIAKRRGGEAASALEGQQIQVGMLRIDGPVWLPPASPARPLLTAAQPGPSVTFLGGTAETPLEPTPQQLAQADALGRITRALPLYLAEQAELLTATSGRAMLPWAVGASSGFVVSGMRWPDETAIQAVSDPQNRSDYVVIVHIDAEVEPWTAELAFIRTQDGARIGELEAEFTPESLRDALPRLAAEVVELLSAFGPATSSSAYNVPTDGAFPSYLLRLEQLLAVRCASMEGVPAHFLSGEREILNGQLELCLHLPQSLPARLLLVETLAAMRKVRPEIAAAFEPRFIQLIQEHPLPALDAVFA